MRRGTTGVFLLATFSASALAQPASDSCSVTVSWSNPDMKLGGGVFVLGKFNVSENEQESTRKSFLHEDANLFAIARVDYARRADLKGEPLYLSLNLRVSASNGDALLRGDREAEAGSFWRHNGYMTVIQNIRIDNLIYRYTLSCQGSGFRPRLRLQRH
jgi:hypothetical protein